MRARIVAKASLFYGKAGSVIRLSDDGLGSKSVTIWLDDNRLKGDTFAVTFFAHEVEFMADDELGFGDEVPPRGPPYLLTFPVGRRIYREEKEWNASSLIRRRGRRLT